MKLPLPDAHRCVDLLDRVDRFAVLNLKIFKRNRRIVVENDLEARLIVRERWQRCSETVIENFIHANNDLSVAAIQLLKSWKKRLRANFVVVAYCPQYAVFYSVDDYKFYGVVALTDGFDVMLPYKLPVFLETILLPYNEYIIWDGLVRASADVLDEIVTSTILDAYEEAKNNGEIITTLQTPLMSNEVVDCGTPADSVAHKLGDWHFWKKWRNKFLGW